MALRVPAFNDAKSYGFEWLRYSTELMPVQEGVLAAGDLKVAAAAAGGMRVDIAAGAALVKGDTGTPGTGLSHGLYVVVNDAAVANAVTLGASDPSKPRVDQIVLRVRDSSDLASGADDAIFEVVQGTPSGAGDPGGVATLDNRAGAPALPSDRIRLADVLVPAASSAVTAGNIRDRRPWARGAFRSITRVANAGGTNDYTTLAQTNPIDVDATNLKPRVECSGGPVRVFARGRASINVATFSVTMAILLDDVVQVQIQGTGQSAGDETHVGELVAKTLTPAAGSHKIALGWMVSGNTGTLNAQALIPLEFSVEELVRQNGDNS